MAKKFSRAKKPVRAAKAARKPARKTAPRKTTARRNAASKAKARPTLHGVAFSGPTYKVALMFALCGQPFSYKHIDLRTGVQRSPEFLAINRYGQVPAVIDGALTLCQSGAILQYLADKYKKFGGKSEQQRARAREWLFWDADRLAPGIFRTRASVRGFFNFDPAVATYLRDFGENGLKVLEAQLGKSKFVSGVEPTIGDIACYGVLAFAKEGNFDLASYPNISAWMSRVERLKGFKPPYELLPLHDIA
jgi:glutathione S-transferase